MKKASTMKVVENQPENFAKNIKSALSYLRAEAEEENFLRTAHILDVAMIVIEEDLAEQS